MRATFAPFSACKPVLQRGHTVARSPVACQASRGRRELVLNSSSLVVLGALFHFSGDRPSTIGVKDYGGGLKGLSLCPKTNNCVSTSEGANDQSHYVPAWQYNPEDGRGMRKPASREQAMAELVDVIKTTKPDNFTPTIVKQTEDYVYVECESPTFGFVDDVEFWFPSDKSREGQVEYRSASRLGESDGDINRKRIRTLRKELQKKGWQSVGSGF